MFPFPLWNPRKRAPVYFGVDRDDKFYSTTHAMNKYLVGKAVRCAPDSLFTAKEDNPDL